MHALLRWLLCLGEIVAVAVLYICLVRVWKLRFRRSHEVTENLSDRQAKAHVELDDKTYGKHG